MGEVIRDPQRFLAPGGGRTRTNAVGFVAVLAASALAIGLKQLYGAGYVGIGATYILALAIAMVHFAVVLVVAFRTRNPAWCVYAAASLVGFIGIGAVTPLSGGLLLLRLALNA